MGAVNEQVSMHVKMEQKLNALIRECTVAILCSLLAAFKLNLTRLFLRAIK